MKKIFIAILLMCTFSYAEFKSLDDKQLQEAAKNGVAVIDIRTPAEWKETGVIPSSHKLTFFDAYGSYDVDKWMKDFSKIVSSKEQAFILVCNSANRTKAVGNMLSSQAGFKKVYELSGGIRYGWISKGLKTEK